VAPVGKPERVTATAPVNPFCPAIETVKLEFAIPALAVMAFGERAMLKFWTALTVNVSTVEWVRDPEPPVAVTV